MKEMIKPTWVSSDLFKVFIIIRPEYNNSLLTSMVIVSYSMNTDIALDM